MTSATPTALERDYESRIIDEATLLGYRVHAERPARSAKGWRTPIRGHPGWPDLVIVGHGHAWFVELKVTGNRLTRDQTDWWVTLEAAGLDAGVLFMPADLAPFLAELTKAARA